MPYLTFTHTSHSDPVLPRGQDEKFEPSNWMSLQRIIAHNRLQSLGRAPSDTQRYHAWIKEVEASHGSVNNFICQERLRWVPMLQQDKGSVRIQFKHYHPVPFTDSRDYQILRNDWPYGLAPGITHLVAWSKIPLAAHVSSVDGQAGHLPEDARRIVQGFINKVIVGRLSMFEDAHERVLWFKNWTKQQSVKGVDHVHIMVRDVPADIIDEWVHKSPYEGGRVRAGTW